MKSNGNERKEVTMVHKTFISYKYSEARNLRDDIIEALGDDATYYKGETSDSPDLTDTLVLCQDLVQVKMKNFSPF